ncbi:MAG: hypothetical protein Q8L48_23730 [Archangium sp.]|nr:hypothetical protein [Archangium sp.]
MDRNFTLLLILASSVASAQVDSVAGPDLRDLQSSRNMAMGGAYEALGYGAETIGGNPAGLSLYKRYQIEATGSWDVPQGFGFGSLAVADSTNPLSMGISYHFATFARPEGRTFGHITTVSLAYAFGDLIHLGFTTRHHVLVGPKAANSITINAGLIAKPVSWLTLGFSGHNLIHVYNPEITRYFVASAAVQILGQLTPAFDLRMDFNQIVAGQVIPRLAYHAGVEWLIAQTFPIRIGYQFDGIANHQYISAGVGWFSEGSGIDFAYRHELDGARGQLLSLTLKLQL